MTVTSLHFGDIIGAHTQRWLVLRTLTTLFIPCISRLRYCCWDIRSLCIVNSFDCNPFSFDFPDLWVFVFFFTILLYCYSVWLWLSFYLPCLVYVVFLRSVGLCFSSVLNNFNVLSLPILCVFSIFLTTIFLKKLFILCWSTADQQCCDGFRRVVKDLGHTHTCIHSPPNSPPSQAATLHWAEFPALFNRSLLVIHFTAVCTCRSQTL